MFVVEVLKPTCKLFDFLRDELKSCGNHIRQSSNTLSWELAFKKKKNNYLDKALVAIYHQSYIQASSGLGGGMKHHHPSYLYYYLYYYH